jgi:Flp pilus assembly pilin Flp
MLLVAGRLLSETDGQDLLEYAILSALIALVALVGVTNVGNVVSGVLWQTIAQNF